jgi:hypothetical protein
MHLRHSPNPVSGMVSEQNSGEWRLTRTAIIGLSLVICTFTAGQAAAKERSAKDQALYEKARKDCNGPHYPSGARPFINYAGGWYRCVEPGNSRR